LLPAVQKVRDAAARSKTANNIKQCGLAAQNYHDSKQRFPSAIELLSTPTSAGSYFSFWAAILPFIEQDNLHKTVSPSVDGWAKMPVSIYLSSQDPSANNNLGKLGYGAGNIAVNFQVVGSPSLSARVR
jgi:hypothetical protein